MNTRVDLTEEGLGVCDRPVSVLHSFTAGVFVQSELWRAYLRESMHQFGHTQQNTSNGGQRTLEGAHMFHWAFMETPPGTQIQQGMQKNFFALHSLCLCIRPSLSDHPGISFSPSGKV